MSIHWTLIAGFLYAEIGIILLLLVPFISTRYHLVCVCEYQHHYLFQDVEQGLQVKVLEKFGESTNLLLLRDCEFSFLVLGNHFFNYRQGSEVLSTVYILYS
jgi:hypothetical protein